MQNKDFCNTLQHLYVDKGNLVLAINGYTVIPYRKNKELAFKLLEKKFNTSPMRVGEALLYAREFAEDVEVKILNYKEIESRDCEYFR